MTKTEFINLISFCILMENGKGILAKAPSLVLEKWRNKHPRLLDSPNTFKLERYEALWSSHIDSFKD